MGAKNYVAVNKSWWEKMVDEKCGFTRPWLNLDKKELQDFAAGKKSNPLPPGCALSPASFFADVAGKDVLCLAAGDGQQSAVFGVLGTNVTVVDIAEGQLSGDQKAAKHYGYSVRTIPADMSNLSMIQDESFDLVYQAPSMCYVPAVKPVYSEVVRVLRKNGLYRIDAQNPVSFALDESSWDGTGYRITEPYFVREKKRSEAKNVLEFRHTLAETFNRLVETGFEIQQVQEETWDLEKQNPEPGTWEHSVLYAPGFFIVARKK